MKTYKVQSENIIVNAKVFARGSLIELPDGDHADFLASKNAIREFNGADDLGNTPEREEAELRAELKKHSTKKDLTDWAATMDIILDHTAHTRDVLEDAVVAAILGTEESEEDSKDDDAGNGADDPGNTPDND